MNKVIIGMMLVIGVFWGSGVCQGKKELDQRLILPKDEIWTDYMGGSGVTNFQEYYANGTWVAVSFVKGSTNHDTLRGTWYTRNDTIFETVKNPSDLDIKISGAQKYFFDEDGCLNLNNLPEWKRVKK